MAWLFSRSIPRNVGKAAARYQQSAWFLLLALIPAWFDHPARVFLHGQPARLNQYGPNPEECSNFIHKQIKEMRLDEPARRLGSNT